MLFAPIYDTFNEDEPLSDISDAQNTIPVAFKKVQNTDTKKHYGNCNNMLKKVHHNTSFHFIF